MVTKEEVLQVKTPNSTKSYIPIPYDFLIDLYEKAIEGVNYQLIESNYTLTEKDKVLTALYRIRTNGNGTIGDYTPMVGFQTSHNKKFSVRMFGGTTVNVCSNGCISSDILETRKHTKGSHNDVYSLITLLFSKINVYHNNAVKFMEHLKGYKISAQAQASLLGILNFEMGALNQTQCAYIWSQFTEPEKYDSTIFKTDSLYDFYNRCTQALKEGNSGYLKSMTTVNKIVNNYSKRLDKIYDHTKN